MQCERLQHPIYPIKFDAGLVNERSRPTRIINNDDDDNNHNDDDNDDDDEDGNNHNDDDEDEAGDIIPRAPIELVTPTDDVMRFPFYNFD